MSRYYPDKDFHDARVISTNRLPVSVTINSNWVGTEIVTAIVTAIVCGKSGILSLLDCRRLAAESPGGQHQWLWTSDIAIYPPESKGIT